MQSYQVTFGKRKSDICHSLNTGSILKSSTYLGRFWIDLAPILSPIVENFCHYAEVKIWFDQEFCLCQTADSWVKTLSCIVRTNTQVYYSINTRENKGYIKEVESWESDWILLTLAFPARRAIMGKGNISHCLAAYINIEEQMMSFIPPSYMEVKLQCWILSVWTLQVAERPSNLQRA